MSRGTRTGVIAKQPIDVPRYYKCNRHSKNRVFGRDRVQTIPTEHCVGLWSHQSDSFRRNLTVQVAMLRLTLPSRTFPVFNEFRGRTEYLRTTGRRPPHAKLLLSKQRASCIETRRRLVLM